MMERHERLEQIKANYKFGVMKFVDMEWLIEQLDECLRKDGDADGRISK